jgi:hypothetical protein
VLSTARQRRLAHMYLTFIGNAYVWQDGNENVPKVTFIIVPVTRNQLTECRLEAQERTFRGSSIL